MFTYPFTTWIILFIYSFAQQYVLGTGLGAGSTMENNVEWSHGDFLV